MSDLFYELLRIAIGFAPQLKYVPTCEDWSNTYELSREQSVLGICFAGVQRLRQNDYVLVSNLQETTYLQWVGIAAKIQQRNELVNRQCYELQVKLAK